MTQLDRSLQAWGSPDFEAVLKQEIAQLGVEYLPLQQGLASSSSVVDAPLTVLIHSVSETESAICIRAGIFYQGITGGCSCADDPTPPSENNEYCEVRLEIDKLSAAVMVMPVAE